MPDPKHTVDDIRGLLRSGQFAATASVRALAADYAEMCRAANFRLRRCGDFLRDALRGEALALASKPPPLLEMISALHFPEWEEWDQACEALNLARPPRLALEVVGPLVQARQAQAPLEELLAHHRYLALARAEPAKRLRVLHDLIVADPANPWWKQDAEELEAIRLAELRTEATAAARKGDLVAVHALLNELNEGRWLTAIPADLKEIVTRTSTTLAEATASARLRALVPAIRSALAARSYDQARQIFQQWGAIVKETKMPVPPELRQEIVPLAHWIDEMEDRREQEKEFRVACSILAAAIKGGNPIEQITQLHRKAMGFDFPLPDELAGAYQQTLKAARQEQRVEKRKQLLLTGALVGVVLIALLALGYIIFGMGGK